MRHYGVRGIANYLIKIHLQNRLQYVEINHIKSSLIELTSGVLQGSILGPLFFIIYMNDLENSTQLNPRLFTDDTCLLASNPSLVNLKTICNKELVGVAVWMSVNRLHSILTKLKH